MQCMLAGKCESIESLKYPVLASAKLDGVRAIVLGGKLLSRNLKPIPNAWVQAHFKGLPDGLDGELILGDPTHPDAYRNTVSAVMSEDGEPTEIGYHIFDNFTATGGFQGRFASIQKHHDVKRGVLVVPHSIVRDAEQLGAVEQLAVDMGYEGIMIRSQEGPYKHGRSTAKEGYLLKLKRFLDAEAVVLDTEELMHNGNKATTDLLGHTDRSSHKENLSGLDALGALCCKGLGGTYDGVEFNVGTGFNADERAKFWKIRKQLVGRIVKFKYFPTGSKDCPRFPVYLGWRDPIDV